MQSVVLTCADPDRRWALAEALIRGGVATVTASDETSTVNVVAEGSDPSVTVDGETVIQLSSSATVEDVAAVVRLVIELATLRASLDDSESVAVVAPIVAHDARNALIPMMFAADALHLLSTAPPDELATVLSDGCRRLAAILGRITAVKAEDPSNDVDVNAIIGDLLGTLHAMVGDRVLLTTRLENPLPRVTIHVGDLERVLLNLVINAHDASPPRGRVIISTSHRTVSASEAAAVTAGEWVVIEVEDHGTGMDESTRTRALRPYFTTKPQGNGLGLPSVMRIARAAGGHLVIESLAGHTKVGVWLSSGHVANS